MSTHQASKSYHLFLLIGFLLILIWSAINPLDYVIWSLEVFPAIIGCIILLATYRRWRLTNISYSIIGFFSIILLIGGHYTYSEMPLFNWLQTQLELSRNHYDRLGHIFQGVTSAIIARELLIRNGVVHSKKWLYFIIVCIALSIGVIYEFFEWGVSVFSGEQARAFLAMQGDVWDTHWDLLLAFLGANGALLLFGKEHDRELKKLRQ